MTTRVTMTQTRQGDSAAVLSSGSTYSIRDDLAHFFVGASYATYADPIDHWRRRTNGGAHGEVRRFGPIDASLSHYLPFEGVWNNADSVFEPRHGRQLLLSADPLVGASSTTPVVAIPQFLCLANLLGTKLALEIDVQIEGSANTPTARSLILTFGSTQVLNEATALSRAVGIAREIRNMGATNSQRISNKADGEYTRYQSANSARLTATEDTTADLVLAASTAVVGTADVFGYTYAGAQTLTRARYNVWWTK